VTVASGLERVRRAVTGNPWVVASLVIAIVVGTGLWRSPVGVVLLSGYAIVNSLGVRHHRDRPGSRRAGLQVALRVLAVVPVGLIATLLTPSQLTPSEAGSGGSPAECVRRAAASTVHGSHFGRGGSP
jgi:hypothetical protein